MVTGVDKYRTSLIFECLIFLIPLNLYMWGDWLLVNVQWAFFCFHHSELGNSLILGHKDILYIYSGQSTGIFNIAAAAFWTTGTLLLVSGLIITIFAYSKQQSALLKKASFFIMGAGIILALSAVCRFNGGFAIPVGVPVIFITGWWIYRENRDDEQEPAEPGINTDEESDR
jgi:hypothetical protein